jgi:hypothetical protein
MSGTLTHSFFSGIGANNYSTSLPVQTLLESQKDLKWKKAVLDRLEQIGESQLVRNIEFNDYYKIISGDLIYTDYGLPDLTKEIVRLRDEMDFPIHAKHFDFLGIIVNQIKGEYPNFKDSYKVDNTDPISQNEFVRTRTDELRNYTQKIFNLELEKKLLEKGITINESQQFNSEEEKQAYLQQLEQQKAAIIDPATIQKQMSKNWKTVAAEWAEKTLEYDQQRYDMDKMNSQEIEDYILTGRWFRHYHVGYDFYKPERWNPCTTFISEDVEAEYPQDGEYIGRIHWLSPSDIINRYGDKIPEPTQRRLLGYFNKESYGSTGQRSNPSLEEAVQRPFGDIQHIPFEGYHDYDLTLQLQDVFQSPMGETTIMEDGVEKKVPAWFSPINNGTNYMNNHYASALRSDIEIRNDLLQVMEGYWRSFKRVGLLTYLNKEGLLTQVVTTDDLLSEFLEENEIKTLRKISLEKAEINPEPNTICYTWLPESRWGVKVKAGNSYLTEDLYIGGDATPFQIKSNSNSYDIQLPVAGYIGKSLAKKIRPFIIKYNIVLNQIHSLLEKELGTFFLFDVHYLPSEYKNGNTRQQLEEMYDLIQDLGIVPVDTSKANLQGNVPAMNAFMTQSLDFTTQIQNRMGLANQFKLMALEQIGITPQRIGAPSKYETVEGIEQGMMATYAQTQPIFDVMSSASKKSNLLHITVAQYCQKNNKDYSFIYTKSDGDKAFIELSDPHFSVREWGLVPIGSSKDKKALETLKQAILQDNTMNHDVLSLAEIWSSDTMTGIIEIGRRNREEKNKEIQMQNEQQQTLLDKELQAEATEKQLDRDHQEKLKLIDTETDIEVAQLQAFGRLEGKVEADSAIYDRLDKTAQNAKSNEQKDKQLQLKEEEVGLKKQANSEASSTNLKKVNLELAKLREARENRKSKERIALYNKN